MAWPFSRLRSYVANSTPTIKAGDLNSIQDYINHVFNGAKSIKSLWIDGTGDVVSAVAAGDLKVSGGAYIDTGSNTIGIGGFTSTVGGVEVAGSVKSTGGYCIGNRLQADNTRSSATVGAGQSLTVGQAWKDTLSVGWCWIEMIAGPNCQLGRGVNIATLTYTALGRYTVTLTNGPTNVLCGTATVFDNTASVAQFKLTGHTTTSFEINVYDMAGAATDPAPGGGVFVWLFGG